MNLRSLILAPALGVALAMLSAASFSGCLVSFDGYELGDAGETGGTAASGHAGESVSGGTSSAGMAGTFAVAGTSSGGGANNGGGGANNGGGGATAGSGGSAGNPATCPTPLHGAFLVEIPTPGGGIFCIDRTEV